MAGAIITNIHFKCCSACFVRTTTIHCTKTERKLERILSDKQIFFNCHFTGNDDENKEKKKTKT